MKKHFLKRALSMLLCVVMVFGMMPVLDLHHHAHAASGDITSSVNVPGLSVSYDANPGQVITTKGTATCTPSASTINASASSAKGGILGTIRKSTVTITLTNTGYDTALLTFSYTAPASGGTGAITTTGTATGSGSSQAFKLERNGTVTVKLTSGDNTTTYGLSLTNIRFAEVKNSTVSFVPATNGTYTVDGVPITAVTEQTNENTKMYSLVATPNSGASFLAWVDGNGVVLSTAATVSLPFGENTAAVKPIFSREGDAAWFLVDELYLTNNLNDATAAGTTIVLAADGILPAGNYVIPQGDTVLIPYNDGYSLNTSEPEIQANAESFALLGDGATVPYKTPTAFRTLTMAEGAHITVNGAISVNAKLYAGGTGSPVGGVYGPYGHIEMNSGSSITVNSDANLYCWGYITGSGSVRIKNGATVYENFQTMDWRGGNCITDMIDNEYRVFPMSQYYVQNIEVPMTLEAGAIEKGYTASSIGRVGAKGTHVPFVGGGGMFNITDGYIIKDYNEVEDRLEIDVYGNLEMKSLKITMQITAGTPVTVNSANYVLPINGNITVHIYSGSLIVTQDVALLPGAKVIVEDGTNCTLDSGVKFYLVDQTQWLDTKNMLNSETGYQGSGYIGTLPGHNLVPLHYAPGRTTTDKTSVRNIFVNKDGTPRTPTPEELDRVLPDAEVVVNGTVDVSKGYIITTGTVAHDGDYQITGYTGGASIRSEGNGRIIVSAATDPGKFYQSIPSNVGREGVDGRAPAYFEVPVTSALLKNADGSYVVSAQNDHIPSQGSTFVYNKDSGEWEILCNMKGTADGCEYENTVEGAACSSKCRYCGKPDPDAEHTKNMEAPSCIEPVKCVHCGEVFEEALGHNSDTPLSPVESTCYATGLTIGYKCSRCGEVQTAQTEGAI